MHSVKQLTKNSRIGLDETVFVHHLARHPRYHRVTQEILSAVQSGQCQAVTSIVTMATVSERPRQANRLDIARRGETLLVHFPNLKLVKVGRDIAHKAGQLQVRYGLNLNTALQVATALKGRASVLVSGNAALRQLESEIPVIILDDLTGSKPA